jgi:hypothetical protein
MATRRVKKTRKNRKTIRNKKHRSKTGKRWITAFEAASTALERTGSVESAREALRKQALYNARKLFGSVGFK